MDSKLYENIPLEESETTVIYLFLRVLHIALFFSTELYFLFPFSVGNIDYYYKKKTKSSVSSSTPAKTEKVNIYIPSYSDEDKNIIYELLKFGNDNKKEYDLDELGKIFKDVNLNDDVIEGKSEFSTLTVEDIIFFKYNSYTSPKGYIHSDILNFNCQSVEEVVKVCF
jgi:hypothetical protein